MASNNLYIQVKNVKKGINHELNNALHSRVGLRAEGSSGSVIDKY